VFPPPHREPDKDVDQPTVNPVGEAMRMEARIMHKRVQVPEFGELTHKQRDEIRKVVRKHAKDQQITYRSIAMQIGVSDSTVSESLKATYKGDVDKVLRQLNAWVEDDAARRNQDKPLGFYETHIFKSLRDAARIVKNQADTEAKNSVGGDKARIAICFGPSGCGKSEGVKALCINDPNAIYIRVDSSNRSASAFARAIFNAAGWMARRSQSYMGALFEKLKFSGRLLVVDEGHELAEPSLKFIRDLTDVCKIPVLIVATEVLRQRVERPRRGVGNIIDDQFSRRVCIQFDLLRGSDGEGGSKRPFFTLEEIAAIFSDDEVKLTSDGLDMLCAIACTVGIGMLGMASNIYDKARIKAKRRAGKTIDASLLLRAAELVLLPPGFSFSDGGQAIYQQIAASLDRVRDLKRAAG